MHNQCFYDFNDYDKFPMTDEPLIDWCTDHTYKVYNEICIVWWRPCEPFDCWQQLCKDLAQV